MEFLKPSQITHVNRMIDILGEAVFACDFSVPGAGKTYSSNVIGIEMGLPLFVLGPRGSLRTWEKVGDDMDGKLGRDLATNIIFTETYESLRSVTHHQPKNGYLRRFDYQDGSVSFAATQAFKDLVEDGILLVLDECQKIKNDSAQSKAVKALIHVIISAAANEGTRSRVIFLSGTPFEEFEHSINFFKIIGFITQVKLHNTDKNGHFKLLGLAELIDNLKVFYPDEVEKVVNTFSPIKKTEIKELVFNFFTEIVVPYFTSAMPSPSIEFKKDVGNGFYKFTGDNANEQAQKLLSAVQGLQSALSFDEGSGSINYGDGNFSEITLALKAVEVSKIPLFARAARESLMKGKKNKVVIFTNFRETIDRLADLLEDFDPVIYDGRLSNRDQEMKVITAFQEGGSRLLIGNLRKGGVAINLHDTVGDAPRDVFISPTYSILDMHQGSCRTYRENLKSDTSVRVVYGEVGQLETRILAALTRKTENMKQILKLQAKEGVLFPGEYPEFHNL